MFLFYGGYLGCALLTLSAVLAVFPWSNVPLAMICEFIVFLVAMGSRGQILSHFEPAGSHGIHILSSGLHLGFYMMMCLAPWTALRTDFFFGGKYYSSMIIYRLLSFTGIIFFATSKFSDIIADERLANMEGESMEGESMEGKTVREMFLASLGITLLGAIIFLASATSSRRWSFFKSKQTGPEHITWCFEASQLIYDAETKDQQRTFHWLICHPTYLNQSAVEKWLLSLTSSGEILGRGDKKLPKGCGPFHGHSLDSFFTKSLEKFRYYRDAGITSVRVEEHLKKLKREVDERPKLDALDKKLKTMTSKNLRKMMLGKNQGLQKVDEKEEESDDKSDGEGKDKDTVAELRALVTEKDEAIADAFAEKKTAIAERDKAIEDGKRMLGEKNRVIDRLKLQLRNGGADFLGVGLNGGSRGKRD